MKTGTLGVEPAPPRACIEGPPLEKRRSPCHHVEVLRRGHGGGDDGARGDRDLCPRWCVYVSRRLELYQQALPGRSSR